MSGSFGKTGALESMFERLGHTTGAVKSSAVMQLALSWSKEPALFACFKDLNIVVCIAYANQCSEKEKTCEGQKVPQSPDNEKVTKK